MIRSEDVWPMIRIYRGGFLLIEFLFLLGKNIVFIFVGICNDFPICKFSLTLKKFVWNVFCICSVIHNL